MMTRETYKTFSWKHIYNFRGLVYYHHGREHGSIKVNAGTVAENYILMHGQSLEVNRFWLLKPQSEPGVVAYACNPSTWEARQADF